MLSLTPSDQFRKLHPDEAVQLHQASEAKWLRIGINYAAAQVAFEGASADGIQCVHNFIRILLTQGTEPTEVKKLPDKSRLESFDGPAVESEEKK